MKIISNNRNQTEEAGISFAKKLNNGDIVALYGELGAGKTTFVQGVMKGLSVKKRIISPTFIIIRKYQLEGKIKNVYHADLYRIAGSDDLESTGLNEIIENREGVVLIEWAEKIKEILPGKTIEIYFEYLAENKRKITVN